MVSTVADIIEVRSPWDGRVLGSVPAGGERQVDEAVSVALDRHRGPQLPAHRRAAILDRVADLLVTRRERFAATISAEAGKPITAAPGRSDPGGRHGALFGGGGPHPDR